RSTRLTLPTPVPTADEADDIILQDTIHLSLVEQKSHEELKNEDKVKEHLMAEEIEKLVEGTKNVEENVKVDSSTLKQNDNQNDLGNRLEPRRNKESSEVEITAAEQPVNVIEEEEESVEDDYELRRREKGEACRGGLMVNDPPPSSSIPSSSPKPKLSASQHILSLFKPKTGQSLPKLVDTCVKDLTKTQVPIYVAQGLIMERQQSQANVVKMVKIIADAIQQECENLRAEISLQINNAISNHIPSQVDSSVRNYMSGNIFHVYPTQASPASVQEQQYQLYLTMKDNPHLQQDDLPIGLALKYKFKRLHVFDTPCRPSAVCQRDQDDPHDDAHPEGENSAKRQKMTEHGTFVYGESSSGQVNESEPCPSMSGNQEQLDDFDFWTDFYVTDDDELPTEKVSQELVEEMSKLVMKQNYANCQRVPKDSALSLVNQDLLYLKKGNSRPKKIVMSLYMFPVVIFSDDDIEERTSKWLGVESYQQKVNLTAPTSTFPGIKKYKVFSIVSEPVYGIIYKNNKKEKRVMRHQEVHKLCDATLKGILEGLKSYNNNVKHGYVTPSLSKDVEYL
nr:hypothetical protein [Tanacetum cinerariifolium]